MGVKLPLHRMTNDVRSRRAERGLSQADLGVALGVSRQTINAIETGRYLPSLPLAFALGRFFGAPVEEIFTPEPGETG
jgi:putative transcriptional regulator